MKSASRTILICLLSVCASVLGPRSVAAQPAYSVIDLGKAPEPGKPAPYAAVDDFMMGNPSGQTIMSRFIPGSIAAFFWEPGLNAPIPLGSEFESVRAVGISGNGYVIGTVNGAHPFIWSRTSSVSLQPSGDEFAWPLAVNASAVVVGYEYSAKPNRAVVWYPERARVYLDDLAIVAGGPWI